MNGCFPHAPFGPPHQLRADVDFAEIHRQFMGHKYVTLQILWVEYRQIQPDDYGFSRFCELDQRWHRE